MTGHIGSAVIEAAAVWRVPNRSRTMRRNVAAGEAAGTTHAAAGVTTAAPALSEGGMIDDQDDHERPKKCLHFSSAFHDRKLDARRDHETVDW